MESGDTTHNFMTRKLWTDGRLVPAPIMKFPPGYLPCSTTGKVYASGACVFLTYGGNFFSTNSGVDWNVFNLPAGDSSLGPFAILGANLFVGGTGIWRRPLSDMITSVSWKPIVEQSFKLGHNYPNPFNPSTRISFSTAKEGPVTLRVYDILGQEVATLINENRKAGEYTEQFTGSQMTSGVYVYVLRSSEGQLVGRMMLLK